MTKKQKKTLKRIIAAAVLTVLLALLFHFVELPWFVQLVLWLVPYLVIGHDVLRKAFMGIKNGEVFDENFLMAVATVGAIGCGEYAEGVAVMLFYQIGELFQSYAVGKSRKNITALMDIRPDYANIEKDGKLEQVDPDDVQIGTVIVVQPGEKVPIDGKVVEGSSSLNTSALTGESVPREVHVGDEIISGCVNLTGLIKIETSKEFGESTVSKILDLVENSSMKKSRSENFITRFAKYYTPAVCIAALALAVLPPLVNIIMGNPAAWSKWIIRALTTLVISCPCALVISIPLSFFGGIGGASAKGILVKGSNYLEALAKVGTVVFDKTGTLTEGVFDVTAVHPETIDEKELLHLAAHVERYSSHPIAISLKNAYPDEADGCSVENVEEIAGHGVRAVVNGKTVCVGNTKMMDAVGAKWKPCEKNGTIVHVSVDGTYVGHIVVSDRIKADSADAIKALKAEGVTKTVMLTGDKREVGEYVASAIGLDEFHAELLPADKVSELEKLLDNKPSGKTLAFVGDGINDAPVLARADLGIAMGGLGSDAAIEAADVVLMDDKPSKIALGVKIARKTLRLARENTFFAIFIKLLVLVLAVLGIATMWMAVFADVGVTVLAVLNAMRALKV